MELIYSNGCKIPANQMDLLNDIPDDADNDRMFINTAFFIFFSEKMIRKQVKKGSLRKAVLEKFRSSAKYELLRSIYEYRVLLNGSGQIRSRIRLFRTAFRVKLNNWWSTNVSKPKA